MRRSCSFFLCLMASLVFCGASTAQTCQSFQGIDHCAVGAATLGVSTEGLVVQTASGGGLDGVRSTFAPTTLWEADLLFPDDEVEHTVMSSISGGAVTSRLIFEPEGEGQRIRATFTGSSAIPTYSLLVYSDGVLQAAVGGLYGGDDASASRHRVPNKVAGLYLVRVRSGSGQPTPVRSGSANFSIAAPGGCHWGLSFDDRVSLELPNGSTVEGDAVVFAEEVVGPGHYPYLGFEAIQVTTSVSQFTIAGEFVEAGGGGD